MDLCVSLLKLSTRKKSQIYNHYFSDDQLYFIAKDLMFPSMSALAITISTLFQNLLHHPDMIKKIQDEIDEVVGSGRLPHLDDRIK